jgi:hypothetical protein
MISLNFSAFAIAEMISKDFEKGMMTLSKVSFEVDAV